MKSLGSGDGDQKNRRQRERTGRGLEGDAIGAREMNRAGDRGMLKQWEEKGGWVKERGTVRYTMQFESLDPADPHFKCIFAFMWLVPLTNKLCQLNNRNLIHECLQCALLYSL